MARRPGNTELAGTFLAWASVFAIRAVMMMFLAAVVAKRFGVLGNMGFMEALAWSGGYALVRGLWKKEAGE